MNEVFRLVETIRIKTRNSYLNLNILFEKPVTNETNYLILDQLFEAELQKF